MILKNTCKTRFTVSVLLVPLVYLVYFLYIWLESTTIGCNNCSWDTIPYEWMIILLCFNGLFFIIINIKKIKMVIAVSLLNIFLIFLLIYMSTFHIFINYEQYLEEGMLNRMEFIYNNSYKESGAIFNMVPYENIMIELFARKGKIDLFIDLDSIDGWTNTILTEKIPPQSENNVEQYCGSVRLIARETGQPIENIEYSAYSHTSKVSIKGKTNDYGYTETVCGPHIESIRFLWRHRDYNQNSSND